MGDFWENYQITILVQKIVCEETAIYKFDLKKKSDPPLIGGFFCNGNGGFLCQLIFVGIATGRNHLSFPDIGL